MNTNETTASTEPTSDDPNVIRSLDDKIDNTLRALVGMAPENNMMLEYKTQDC